VPVNFSDISQNTVPQWRKRTTVVAAAAAIFTRAIQHKIYNSGGKYSLLQTQPTRHILINGNFSAMLASLTRTEIQA